MPTSPFSTPSGIHLVISHRSDGNMRFSSKAGKRWNQQTLKNRLAFFADHHIPADHVVNPKLLHSDHIEVIGRSHAGEGALTPAEDLSVDGLVTNEPGVMLMITVADCVPVFFYDPRRRVVGLAHAGWQGTIRGIVPKMVTLLKREFGVDPFELQVWLGAGIGPCHYHVKEDVASLFESMGWESGVAKKERGHYALDLRRVIVEQLESRQVPDDNIQVHAACTACNTDRYFSLRKDRPRHLEAIACLIGLMPAA